MIVKTLLCLAILSFASGTLAAQERNAELHKLFADMYEETIRLSPELATNIGRNEFNDRWTDYSPAAIEANRDRLTTNRKKLAAFRTAKLNDQDRLSLEILDRQLARAEESFDLNTWYYLVSQTRGPHLGVPTVLQQTPTRTVAEYEQALARIRKLPVLAEQWSTMVKVAADKNLLQPKRVVELTLKQLDVQASTEPTKSPILAAFYRFPTAVPEPDQKRLQAEAVKAYTDGYQPAWRKLRQTIESVYLAKARSTIALSEMPNGREHYARAIREYTTTDLTADQIHEIGLKEVERIQAEMAAIRKEVGFSGSGADFVTQVLEAPNMLFKSEAEILAHGREIAKRLDPELPRLFKVLPRMPYGVQAIPPDRAQTAAPYYQAPSTDGTRAGNFFLRTYLPEKQSKCCLEALIIHEAVPGHHLQIALARELEGMPEFRKIAFFGAFIEGWGLYAETLGPELGMYKSPYERYGKLQNEILRAVRLVVDTGIHAKGWPREKAVELMQLAKGGFVTDALIEGEIDRYISWPAQALSYKVGGLKIQQLRQLSEKELGARFNIRDFHHVVLRNGALPLDLLETEVRGWISQVKADPAKKG